MVISEFILEFKGKLHIHTYLMHHLQLFLIFSSYRFWFFLSFVTFEIENNDNKKENKTNTKKRIKKHRI